MRITDHVYLLSGAGYGLMGNVYGILHNEKLILIDTGDDAQALETILESLADHRLADYPITHVLITHMHRDHSGNAWYFREQGARILMSAEGASGLEQGGIRANDFGLEPFRTCKVDQHIRDGETLNLNGLEITAMLVPGHTNGGLFFLFNLDNKRFCCTGDTVFPVPCEFDYGIEASLGWIGSAELDKAKYLETLTRAASIECDILLGGHGVPVLKHGDHIIKKGLKLAIRTFRNGG